MISRCIRRTGFPLAFWEQLANAVSIVLANVYVWQESRQILDQSVHVFDVEIIRWFSLLHCPCSVSYHVTLLTRSGCASSGLDHKTWTRVLDMGAVHVCCAAFSWVLSHAAWFAAANLLANSMCVCMMVRRTALGGSSASKGESVEYWRLAVCVMVYPTAMLLRGRVAEFLNSWLFLVLMCCLQFVSPFGHAASRIPLALFILTLLKSAADA